MDTHEHVRESLSALRSSLGCPVLLYAAESISIGDLHIVHECLRRAGTPSELAVVLHTSGGDLHVAHRVAVLLREQVRALHILVPEHARSAGTMLCLAAEKLTMGAGASLGPIDPQITASGQVGATELGTISTEDIRKLPEMCADWYGRQDSSLALHALLRSISPPTLSRFYRADKAARKSALELLELAYRTASADWRESIADRLLSGYDSHRHLISPAEARRIGLAVTTPDPELESLLHDCVAPIRDSMYSSGGDLEPILGLVAGDSGFVAAQRIRRDADGGKPRIHWVRD
ncbi:hypothetical protein [Amycolatopsis sp. YIM 10]|uniref:SDH family Clp fold serine proteinase n=1 Tax=Amycolatopsis sp. YIM 10 TaxID=2653857 RepID=UPI00129008D7|nr:hypothetical protein [Amycolatopsis sp. YIM 10]QFU90264.1 Serine dehydrogenase proteinase [Amycolatopsis sp. YIM 10]